MWKKRRKAMVGLYRISITYQWYWLEFSVFCS
jgi:hypothetical protein